MSTLKEMTPEKVTRPEHGRNYRCDEPLLEITQLINDPTCSLKVKRAILRDKYKLSEHSIDELCPMTEVIY